MIRAHSSGGSNDKKCSFAAKKEGEEGVTSEKAGCSEQTRRRAQSSRLARAHPPERCGAPFREGMPLLLH